MKLNILIFLGLLITTGFLHAQTDFRPGYVIKNSGDTLYGEIDYRGDLLMSSICKFKNADNTIKEYFPNDISAFRFTDSKYFVSKQVNGKNIFLEYLIKGKVDIYYMRDGKGNHYYLDKETEKLTEIPFEEGIKYTHNKLFDYKSTRHIGLLSYYMQDAPEFQSRIKSIKKPEHDNLIKLAEDYHNAVCEDEECIVYEKKLPFIKVSFEPFWGLTKYNGYDKFLNEIGGYLYLWAPRTNEKLFFKTGLSYHKISEDGDNLKIFKIPIQIQYMYTAYSIQPRVSCGVSFWNLKYEDYKNLGYTLNFNAGLNYSLSESVSLSTNFNTDFTPISLVIMEKDFKFSLISYSILVGLFINL